MICRLIGSKRYFHADVLQMEIFHTYKITKGDKYGTFKEIMNEYNANI